MENEIVKFNSNALAKFDKTIASANNLLDANAFHDADWFDTPEKRLTWWFELEPQWRKAFSEAVFFEKQAPLKYRPSDKELQTLFSQRRLLLTGSGKFRNRNVSPCISFQLSNLSGLTNLTNVTTLELDYNREIESLEPLSKLRNLEYMTIDNNSIKDLSPLMDLQNMRSLCIWNNQIENLESLASLMKLTALTLGLYDEGNPIKSYDGLQYLTNLSTLYLNACPKFDLGLLDKLDSLYYVDLSNSGYTDDDIKGLRERDIYVKK